MRFEKVLQLWNPSKFCLYVIFLLSCAMLSWSHAAEVTDQDNAELIKLRIKELELKKEILELEAKKESRQQSQRPPPQQSYSTPEGSNSNHLDTSRYIRGPRGGCYTYTKSGNKKYVDRSLCN